jgi:PKD repeat protein
MRANRLAPFGGALVAGLVVLALFAVGVGMAPRLLAVGHVSAAADPATGSIPCNPANLAPSSLAIPLAGPTGSGGPNVSVGVAVEFAVATHAVPVRGLVVNIPSSFGIFPVGSGTPIKTYHGPTAVTLSGLNWTGPLLTSSIGVPANATFSTSSDAYLSTEKMAVMVNTGYGNLTIEVRWQWSLTVGSTTTFSPWSVPSLNATSPYLPSIFYPAPTVLATSHSGPVVAIGQNYTDNLTGAVANTTFRLVLENLAGNELNSVFVTTPSGTASTWTASLPVLDRDHYLVPGDYLFHVHDVCNAIVSLESFKAVYPANPTTTVLTDPATCGPVNVNGTQYPEGTSLRIAPSSAAIPIAVGPCWGATFEGWTTTGGVEVTPAANLSSTLFVSASGEAIAVFSSGGVNVTASANVTSGSFPLAVAFHANASGGAPPYSYNWTFGDGGASNLSDPTHVYETRGAYTAEVHVLDAAGFGGIATVSIAPSSGSGLNLTATSNVTDGAVPLAVQFGVTAPGGAGLTFAWSFGDGANGTGPAPTHTYTTPGNFTVGVVAENGTTVLGNANLIVRASAPLRVALALSATSLTVGGSTALLANASGGAPPYTYEWSADGVAFGSNSSSAQYQPGSAGSVLLLVEVIDSRGAVAQASATLVIHGSASSSTRAPWVAGLDWLVAEWKWVALIAGLAALAVAGTLLARRRAPPASRPPAAAPGPAPRAP